MSVCERMMRNDRVIAYILISLMVVLFTFVGFQMFRVRAEVNGAYPEYSSFRADPKGYRILYETLSRLGSVRVERFEEPLAELPSAAGKILVMAGLDPRTLSTEKTKLVDDWMTNGGTMVATFSSLHSEELNRDPKPNSGAEQNKSVHVEIGKSDSWGIRVFHSKLDLVTQLRSNVFKEEFSWAGHFYIDPTKGDWAIVAKAGDLPVVLERKFGAGRLVLLADSYPLSNIALAAHRNAELVSWLFPGDTTVIFDESHLGIVNHPGIIGLARRYGLDGAIVAILGLAILYLWANRYTLKPARKIRSDADPSVKGIGGTEMFTNLLRRSLPSNDLCAVALEISKQKGSTNPAKQARLESLLRSLPPTTSQVERYNQIVKLQHS